MRLTTLCFLRRGNEILLAMKKRGFGAGKWNGAGGKVEENEDVRAAAARELEEEIGVRTASGELEEFGSLKFYFANKPEWDQHMHIFVARAWAGEPEESEEMRPMWHPVNAIPFDEMWEDDKYWLPRLIAGTRIEGEFHFSEDGKHILRFSLQEEKEPIAMSF